MKIDNFFNCHSGVYTTLTMINTPVHTHTLVIAVNMFVRRGNDWLVIKRSPKKEVCPNIYHAIGGKLELGEDPMVAAQRELMEEAGLKVKNVRFEAYITETFPPDHPKYRENWVIMYFSGDYDGGELIETDEGQLIWMPQEKLLSLTAEEMFPSLKAIIHHIVNPQDGTVFARFVYNHDTQMVGKTILLTAR